MPNAVALLMTMVPPGAARNYTLAIFAASPPCGAMIGALLVGTFFQLAEWKWFFIFMCVSSLSKPKWGQFANELTEPCSLQQSLDPCTSSFHMRSGWTKTEVSTMLVSYSDWVVLCSSTLPGSKYQ